MPGKAVGDASGRGKNRYIWRAGRQVVVQTPFSIKASFCLCVCVHMHEQAGAHPFQYWDYKRVLPHLAFLFWFVFLHDFWDGMPLLTFSWQALYCLSCLFSPTTDLSLRQIPLTGGPIEFLGPAVKFRREQLSVLPKP